MKTALTIAGSDSSGGAGIQADLKTFAAFGVYGTSAITAVTAQNTSGIAAAAPLPADLVTAQIETVAADMQIHATKIGMLATSAIVEAVAAAIVELELPIVVLDPVLVSSSGERLLDADGIQALRRELLPLARVVTPNIPEAEALSGRRIRSLDDARGAARQLHDMGARAVIIKGGHAPVRTDYAPATDVIDLLVDDRAVHEFRTARVESPHAHGTGCAFASAVAAGLALGFALTDAARDAQAYVAGAIRHGLALGHGRGLLDHFWTRADGPPEGGLHKGGHRILRS
jgi:hydroxymethylpyrimidine/phosphomethylpyrimidine kinase